MEKVMLHSWLNGCHWWVPNSVMGKTEGKKMFGGKPYKSKVVSDCEGLCCPARKSNFPLYNDGEMQKVSGQGKGYN